jgi:hypothetical protein
LGTEAAGRHPDVRAGLDTRPRDRGEVTNNGETEVGARFICSDATLHHHLSHRRVDARTVVIDRDDDVIAFR